MLKKKWLGLSMIFAFVLIASVSFASQLLLDNLPGATTYGDLAMDRNDDGSSSELDLPFAINFYGTTYNQFWVNNNGNITFERSLGTYTPYPFPIASQPIIAPWWSDVDTRGGNVLGSTLGNNVYVSAPNESTVVVTWNNVGYYSGGTDKLNNFQLVLKDRPDTGDGNFDIEFRYNRLEWTTGSASGGSGGLGGTPAQAGFDAGNLTDFYTLPGSRTDAVLNLVNTSNVSEATPGLWSFAVRNGQLPGATPDNPHMPVIVDDTFTFDFNINLNQQVFIDPVVAIGYDYQVTSGPNFAGVLLPVLGDNIYDLYLWNGTNWLFSQNLTGGTAFAFLSGGVDRFRILGIEAGLGLDPTDPIAFVTGLTFVDAGQVQMSMTPITFDTGNNPVPEPGTFLLMGFGLFGISYLGRRRKDS